MRYMITDELWATMEPLVEQAKKYTCGAQPELSERMFLEALLYLARTAVPWRDLPGEFGSWDAVYNRFRRWVRSGKLRRLFELLTADPQFEGVRRVLFDSTIVRAHQHAAGAPRKKSVAGPSGARRTRRSAAAGAGFPPRSS
jgi:transposase